MRKYITHSRKKIPWDENSMTILQKYLSEITLRNYYIKHPNLKQPELTVKESDVFNSFEINECRYCCSKYIIKYNVHNLSLIDRFLVIRIPNESNEWGIIALRT